MADIDISVNVPSNGYDITSKFFTIESGELSLTANTMSGNITLWFGQTFGSIPDIFPAIIAVGSETSTPTSVTGSVSVYVDKVTTSSCVLKAISSTTQNIKIKILVIK